MEVLAEIRFQRRGYVSESALLIPPTLAEALALRSRERDDLIVMGGGTIVMQGAAEGHLIGRRLMSLRCAGLDLIEMVNGHVRIGATTNVRAIHRIDGLPLLTQAAATLGGPAVKNVATIGGNLFARPPWGDMTVALLALDAQVELAGAAGKRSLPLAVFLGCGCGNDELVTAVMAPKPAGATAFLKLCRRRANSPAVVAVGVRLETGADGSCQVARVALSGADHSIVRSRAAESELEGGDLSRQDLARAAQAAMETSSPFSDALASEWYRRKMVGVFVRRALESALDI